jgi:hypothetical protein
LDKIIIHSVIHLAFIKGKLKKKKKKQNEEEETQSAKL